MEVGFPTETLHIAYIALTYKTMNFHARFEYRLLERDLFDPPAFLTHQLAQASQHLGAEAGGIAGEVDQVALAILEDLEAEAVFPMEGDQRSINGLYAELIAFLVAGRAQHDGDLLRWMVLILFFLDHRHI